MGRLIPAPFTNIQYETIIYRMTINAQWKLSYCEDRSIGRNTVRHHRHIMIYMVNLLLFGEPPWRKETQPHWCDQDSPYNSLGTLLLACRGGHQIGQYQSCVRIGRDMRRRGKGGLGVSRRGRRRRRKIIRKGHLTNKT